MTDFKLPRWYQLAHKIPEKFNHHLLQAGMNQFQDITDREQSLTRPHNALHDLVWDLLLSPASCPLPTYYSDNRALLSVAQMHDVCSDHRAFAHVKECPQPHKAGNISFFSSIFLPQEGFYDLSTPDSDSSLYLSSGLLEQFYFCDDLTNPCLSFTPYLRTGTLFTKLLYSVWHIVSAQ